MDFLTWQAMTTLIVIGSVFCAMILTRIPADFALLAGLGILCVSGILSPSEALSGFSSEGMITIGLLYVVVSGLQETGVLTWISHHVLGRPKNWRRAQLRLMLPVIGISAFLNNTPVVAMFIPVVAEWCRKIRVQPSRLMIPLSYAAIFGGICTMIGTSTNLVVNALVQERYHSAGLAMFEITKLGLPCAIAGMAYLLVVSRFLLPERTQIQEIFHDPKEYTLELEVEENSPVIGRSIESSGLRHLPGAFLAELIRGEQVISAVDPDEPLRAHDRLVFVGNIDSMRTLYHQKGLVPSSTRKFNLDAPKAQRRLVEVVVSDTCPIIGKTIRDGRFRNRYNAVVIAVARNGERISGKIGDIVLRAGDMLLVESHAGFIPRQKDSRDFYLISEVEDSTPRRFDRAPYALAVLIAMVILAGSGILSMLKASMVAAGAMLLLGCCSTAQARRSIEWNVLLVIGAALGMSMALETTGAAAAIAGSLLGLTRDQPGAALAMVCLTTTLLTELITNNAAAAIVFPIAMNTADRLGVNPMPFIISVMICASASFATPIGYQTNLMVYGPGGYKFSDYLKIGIPLNFLYCLLTAILAPMIWSFAN